MELLSIGCLLDTLKNGIVNGFPLYGLAVRPEHHSLVIFNSNALPYGLHVGTRRYADRGRYTGACVGTGTVSRYDRLVRYDGTVRWYGTMVRYAGTVRWYGTWYGTVRYGTWYGTVRYGAVHGTVRYGTVHGTVRYGTVHGTVRYGTVRYGTVLYIVGLGTVRYGTWYGKGRAVRYGLVQCGTYGMHASLDSTRLYQRQGPFHRRRSAQTV